MTDQLLNIPTKKLKILNRYTRIGRLSSQLNFLKNCSKIALECYQLPKVKNFLDRAHCIFYKFTGKIKKPINYKKYKALYTYKELKFKLKIKTRQLKIIYK